MASMEARDEERKEARKASKKATATAKVEQKSEEGEAAAPLAMKAKKGQKGEGGEAPSAKKAKKGQSEAGTAKTLPDFTELVKYDPATDTRSRGAFTSQAYDRTKTATRRAGFCEKKVGDHAKAAYKAAAQAWGAHWSSSAW